MPGVDMPVGRQPVSPEEMRQIHNIQIEDLAAGSLLFDILDDPQEERNLAGTAIEEEVAAKLKGLMEEQGAPPEQFERLGLA